MVSYAPEVLLPRRGFPSLLLVITISFSWFEENRGSSYLNFLPCCKHFNKQLTPSFFPLLDGHRFSVQKQIWHRGIQPCLSGMKSTAWVWIVQRGAVLVSLEMCCQLRQGPWVSVSGVFSSRPAPSTHRCLVSEHFKYKHDCSSEVLL